MKELLNACSNVIAVRTNGAIHLRNKSNGRLLFAGSTKECEACLRGILIARSL